MEVSKSYPFLSIAKKCDLDYGLVLNIAHDMKHKISFRDVADRYHHVGGDVFLDVQEALLYFSGVKSGVIPFPPA